MERADRGRAGEIEAGQVGEGGHERVGGQFLVRPAVGLDRIVPVLQQIDRERRLQPEPLGHVRKAGQQPQQGELAPVHRGKVGQVAVGQAAVEIAVEARHIGLHGREVEAVGRGKGGHVGREVLEGLAQGVAGQFGPVGTDAVDVRILGEDISGPGPVPGADRGAGRAAHIGHALAGQGAVGQAREIFVAQSGRLGRAGLDVDLQAARLGRGDELPDDRAVGCGQLVGRAGLVDRIAEELGPGCVARAACHPERVASPERPVEAAHARARIVRRLEAALARPARAR